MSKLKLALPNKGRMQQAILTLLADAGLSIRGDQHDRALVAQLGDDFEALFVRAADIPELVADGVVDAGITGWDLVQEADRNLSELLDLQLGKCSLILAVPTASEIDDIGDFQDNFRVATSFPHLAEVFFSGHGKPVAIVPVSGAAEAAPQLGIADGIVDLLSTGSTLRVNGLKQIEVVLHSSARLVIRDDRAPNELLDDLAVALQSVLHAKDKRYLMANVPRGSVGQVQSVLPGLRGPTIIDVFGTDDVVAVHAVVEASAVFRTVTQLKGLGGEGILVTRIERLMP